MMSIYAKLAGFLLAVALIFGALYGAYHYGQTLANAEWQAKWNTEVAKQADAKSKAEQADRAEELRRINSNQQAKPMRFNPLLSLKLMLLPLLLLLAACSSQPQNWQPDQVAAPAIPSLPLEARQPITSPWCSPTCSRGLTNEQQTWLPLLTSPE